MVLRTHLFNPEQAESHNVGTPHCRASTGAGTAGNPAPIKHHCHIEAALALTLGNILNCMNCAAQVETCRI